MNKKLSTSLWAAILVSSAITLLGLYLAGSGAGALTSIFGTRGNDRDKNLEEHPNRVPEHVSVPRVFFDEAGRPITDDFGNPLIIFLPAFQQ